MVPVVSHGAVTTVVDVAVVSITVVDVAMHVVATKVVVREGGVAAAPRFVVPLRRGLAPRTTIVAVHRAFGRLGSRAGGPAFPLGGNGPVVVATTAAATASAATPAPPAAITLVITIAGLGGLAIALATRLAAGRSGLLVAPGSAVIIQPAVILDPPRRTLVAASSVIPAAFRAELLSAGRRRAGSRLDRTCRRPRRSRRLHPAGNTEFRRQAVPIPCLGQGFRPRLLPRLRRGGLRPSGRGAGLVVGRRGAK